MLNKLADVRQQVERKIHEAQHNLHCLRTWMATQSGNDNPVQYQQRELLDKAIKALEEITE